MKKGFTLIELLVVIILIAAIVLLALPKITNSVKNYSNKTDALMINMIEKAAKLYVEQHFMKHSKIQDNKYIITLDQLVEEGYLKAPIKMSKENGDIISSKCIQITYIDEYQYELKLTHECEGIILSCKLMSGSGNNVGDKISCDLDNSTENFYIIKNDGINIEMLAEKNINSTGIGQVIQMDNAGYIPFSSKIYWVYQSENENLEATAEDYVYNENNDRVKPIVDQYLIYLNRKLKIATGNLLSNTQIQDISNALKDNDKSWVYSTTYWLGNSSNYGYIYYISSEEDKIVYNRSYFANGEYVGIGIRPVITIPLYLIMK